MEREIKSIAAHKTALISALVVFVMVLILTGIQLLLTAIGLRGAGFNANLQTLQLVLAPVMYFVVIYVLSFVLCKIYNLLAPRVGGIRVKYEDQQP
jgi:O-antigen ligase